MTLDFAEPQNGFDSPCRFGYESDYLVSHYEQIETLFAKAVSARVPLNWEQGALKQAPAFLYDIAPAGDAKRFLMARIGQEKPEGIREDLFLLARSTLAPVGHMRIKESLRTEDGRRAIGFERKEVVGRDNRFLEYAYEEGAAIGGATEHLRALPDILVASGLPDVTLNHPQIGLRDLDQRLKTWGLR